MHSKTGTGRSNIIAFLKYGGKKGFIGNKKSSRCFLQCFLENKWQNMFKRQAGRQTLNTSRMKVKQGTVKAYMQLTIRAPKINDKC